MTTNAPQALFLFLSLVSFSCSSLSRAHSLSRTYEYMWVMAHIWIRMRRKRSFSHARARTRSLILSHSRSVSDVLNNVSTWSTASQQYEYKWLMAHMNTNALQALLFALSFFVALSQCVGCVEEREHLINSCWSSAHVLQHCWSCWSHETPFPGGGSLLSGSLIKSRV